MDTIVGNTAIEFDAPSAVPGTIIRPNPCTEPLIFDAEDGPVAFGDPYKIDDDGVTLAIEAGDTAEDVHGFVVRQIPSMAPNSSADALDYGVPHPGKPQSGLVRGSGRNYMAALCVQGTPKRARPVYMRVVEDLPLKVGGLEADADGAATAAAMVGTGNATSSAVVVSGAAQTGEYVALMTAATKFNLQGPDGTVYKQGTLGTAYTAGGLTFTLTAGATPAVAGDTITITVVMGNIPLPGVTWAIAGKDADNRTQIRIQ
jgi:hypothetical protein